MRIISGSHKGRKLLVPKKLPARPTTDFAKESLFNILRNRVYFDELSVLDLFAGTGSISYEFASRGVPAITAVDSHFGSIRYITKVSDDFNFPIQAIKADVFKFLENPKNSYHLIFCDPPYDFELEDFEKLIQLIFENGFLKEGGVLIIEHYKRKDLSTHPFFVEKRNYGDSVFSFFSTSPKK